MVFYFKIKQVHDLFELDGFTNTRKTQNFGYKKTTNVQFISFSMNEINRKLKNLLSPTPPHNKAQPVELNLNG